MKNCGLTDSDIEALNCPSGLDVYVDDFGTDGARIEVARAKVSYKGKYCNYYRDFDVIINPNNVGQSKVNFMVCIKEILGHKCQMYTRQDEGRVKQELHNLKQRWNSLTRKKDNASCNELLVNAKRQDFLENILKEIQTTGSAARVVEKYPYSPCGIK